MAHLWKSFVDVLAPPKCDEQPRREGVALSRMVDEHQLSCHGASSQAGGQRSIAPPGYREVTRANLNIPPQRIIPSARVAEVDSSGDDEFEDSKEEHHPQSLAESITATRVPQIATQLTSQPSLPNQSRHQAQQVGPVEAIQTPSPSLVESVESVNPHTANLLEDVKYFHNAVLSYQDAYEAL